MLRALGRSMLMPLLLVFCSKTDRLAKGAECYQKSLSENPFLWSPFESLCQIGQYVYSDVPSIH